MHVQGLLQVSLVKAIYLRSPMLTAFQMASHSRHYHCVTHCPVTPAFDLPLLLSRRGMLLWHMRLLQRMLPLTTWQY